MLKPSMQHIDSLVRAQTALLKGYDTSCPAVARRQFDDDLLNLEAIKKLIMQMIYEPGLPFTNIEVPGGPHRGPENPES